MKTTLLILTLSLTAFGCPENIVELTGRVIRLSTENGYQGVARATVSVIRDDGAAEYRTANQFGYFRLEVPNCHEYRITATSKGRLFMTQLLRMPDEDYAVIVERPNPHLASLRRESPTPR